MFAIDRDVIKRDEFLHFYRLRKSKDLSYWEYKPWDRASKLIINSPLSLYNWKPNFFFISGNGWEFVPGEGLDEASKFFRRWGTSVSDVSFLSVLFVLYLFFVSDDDM